jgi:hypothetical protein
MKIHDFGLWFKEAASGKWSVTIPTYPHYFIYYDGRQLGKQWVDFDLTIYDDEPHIIRLKNKFPFRESYRQTYALDRPITLEDFEIVKNPDYRGDQ